MPTFKKNTSSAMKRSGFKLKGYTYPGTAPTKHKRFSKERGDKNDHGPEKNHPNTYEAHNEPIPSQTTNKPKEKTPLKQGKWVKTKGTNIYRNVETGKEEVFPHGPPPSGKIKKKTRRLDKKAIEVLAARGVEGLVSTKTKEKSPVYGPETEQEYKKRTQSGG